MQWVRPLGFFTMKVGFFHWIDLHELQFLHGSKAVDEEVALAFQNFRPSW